GGTCRRNVSWKAERGASDFLERSLTMKSTDLQHQSSSGTPWTARDIRRLKAGLRAGTSIPHLAMQLRREIGDVRAKVDELTAQYLAEWAGRAIGAPRHRRP